MSMPKRIQKFRFNFNCSIKQSFWIIANVLFFKSKGLTFYRGLSSNKNLDGESRVLEIMCVKIFYKSRDID